MSNPFLGELRLFAGTFNPRGWAFCAGQILPIDQNDALYALIGTTFGGDGQVTFGLPDLRGRVAIGQGQGSGLSSYVVGQESGTESVTLSVNEMPQHTHAVTASSADATATTPTGAVPARPSAATVGYLYLSSAATGATDAPPAAAAISVVGGSQPHDNMAPSLVLNYIIALEGVFPSRN
ncbi:MAG: Tail Collar domain protein [Sphingomonas bacterium]|uniref:phage tail protein n=1 Tax=Sphingomonas bacterium TaxID=1895847 RepID=UPI002614DC30|nr:tail fiber protein [Sphingomonas bacterium]MDB5712189.1 Tail Collar domain protein [Sphingomonas bacterium]